MNRRPPKPSERSRARRDRPPFIVFEGVEACGKSTQIERLAGRLRAAGKPCVVTREPGGTPLGESIRTLLLEKGTPLDGLTELFLLSAARHHHVEEVIRPALARGEIVLSDRFADSSVAYQGGGRELPLDIVEKVNRIATGGLVPDLVVLLDLPPQVGFQRMCGRGRSEDRLELEGIDFHERVRAAYLALARRDQNRYRVFDAASSEEELAAEVWKVVSRLL